MLQPIARHACAQQTGKVSSLLSWKHPIHTYVKHPSLKLKAEQEGSSGTTPSASVAAPKA